MLTSLNWLKNGEKFPPECERERMQMYSDNKDLFEGGHAQIYKEDLERIQRVIDDFQTIVSYPVIMNFQRLMSLKIADLLLGKPPKITVDDKNSAEQDSIDVLIRKSDLMNIAYQVAIDISRYGDGLFEVCLKDGIPVIGLTKPPIWYPVVSPNDVHEVVFHVLAWETDDDKLEVRIHSKGSVEKAVYQMDNHVILNQLESTTEQTGLSDFAIIQVSNVMTSDRCCGLDDYSDIDSIIGDLMVRIGQVDRILDKHADPSMSGPQSALEKDPRTGQWRLKSANFFPRDSNDDAMVQYIVWDAQLSANFTQIERLVNLLYGLSEMGSALLGESSGNTGQVLTASALRIKLAVPLAKVGRVRMRFDPALKKAVALCTELGQGLSLVLADDISIKWFDGLPTDAKEEAEVMRLRTADKATMSQYRALQQDGLTDEQADEELARILDEQSADAPMKAPPMVDANTNLPPDNLVNIDDLIKTLGG